MFRVTVLTFISMGMVVGPALAQQILDDSAAKVGEDNAKAAMQTVMAKLKDPMSAQFRSFAHPDPRYSQYPKKTVCGMVNAKNGFGGYNGFAPFSYDIYEKTATVLTEGVVNSVAGDLSKLAFKYTHCASALGINP